MAVTEQKNITDNPWGDFNTPNPETGMGYDFESAPGSDNDKNSTDFDINDLALSEAVNMWADLEARKTTLEKLNAENPSDEISDMIAQLDENIGGLENAIKNNGTGAVDATSLMAAMGKAADAAGHSIPVSDEHETAKKKEDLIKIQRNGAHSIAVAAAAAGSLPLVTEFFDRDTALNIAAQNLFEGPNSIESISLQAVDTVLTGDPELAKEMSESDTLLAGSTGPNGVVKQKEGMFDVAIKQARAENNPEKVAKLEEAKATFIENSTIALQEMNVEDPTTEAGQAAIETTLAENPDLVASLGGPDAAREFLTNIVSDGDNVSMALTEQELDELNTELATATPERAAEIQLELQKNELVVEHIGTMIDVREDQAIELEANHVQQGVTEDTILGPDSDPGINEVNENLNAEQSDNQAQGLQPDLSDPSKREEEVRDPVDEAITAQTISNLESKIDYGLSYEPRFAAYEALPVTERDPLEGTRLITEYEKGLLEIENENIIALNEVKEKYGLPLDPLKEIPNNNEISSMSITPKNAIGEEPSLGEANPESGEFLGPVVQTDTSPKEIWEEGYVFDAESYESLRTFNMTVNSQETDLLAQLKSGEGDTQELISTHEETISALQDNIRNLLAESLGSGVQNEMDITAAVGSAVAAGEAATAQGVEYSPEVTANLNPAISTGPKVDITTDVQEQANVATASLETNIAELMTGKDTPATTGNALESDGLARV